MSMIWAPWLAWAAASASRSAWARGGRYAEPPAHDAELGEAAGDHCHRDQDREHPAAGAEHLLAALGRPRLMPAAVARVVRLRLVGGCAVRIIPVTGVARVGVASRLAPL